MITAFIRSCFNDRLQMVIINFFLIMLLIISGCGNDEKTRAADDGNQYHDPADIKSSGYLDINAWEQAQLEIKTIEKTIAAFNDFYDVWGWAYEHRVFLRFKEAIETAGYLPGKIAEAERIAASIRSVPGYPEIDNVKNCYLQMVPLLRDAAQDLENSITAARDNNSAEEKKHVQAYTEKWKAAMKYSRKSFAVFQELLTRGSRVEYSRLTVGGKSAAYDPALFRKAVKNISGEYDTSVMKKVAAIKKLAAGAQWDIAIIKTGEVYTILQNAIMKAGQAEPGNDKANWNTRQELVTTLSQQMMAMKKFGEYLEFSKNGNQVEAGKALKVYEILYKSAADSRTKLKNMGY